MINSLGGRFFSNTVYIT